MNNIRCNVNKFHTKHKLSQTSILKCMMKLIVQLCITQFRYIINPQSVDHY